MIYLELFFVFFKIGLFTFGGGYAMLPLIQQEVIARGWLSLEDTTNFIAVSESTPGPFAVNIATYIGVEKGGVFGAICSTFGVILPSFAVILLVAKFIIAFRKSKYMSGALYGVKPVAVGLIGAAALSIAAGVFAAAWTGFDSLPDYRFLVPPPVSTACLTLVRGK